MILEKLADFSTVVLELLFSIIPKVPDLPDELYNKIFNFLDMLFEYSSVILSLFIRIETIKIIVPILIIVINLDKIYSLFMWVLKKIPFASLK